MYIFSSLAVVILALGLIKIKYDNAKRNKNQTLTALYLLIDLLWKRDFTQANTAERHWCLGHGPESRTSI